MKDNLNEIKKDLEKEIENNKSVNYIGSENLESKIEKEEYGDSLSGTIDEDEKYQNEQLEQAQAALERNLYDNE